MVQRSCGSGSVPVCFMPAMLGCTKHPSVGTHEATAERIGYSLMLQRQQNLRSKGRDKHSLWTYPYAIKQIVVQWKLNRKLHCFFSPSFSPSFLLLLFTVGKKPPKPRCLPVANVILKDIISIFLKRRVSSLHSWWYSLENDTTWGNGVGRKGEALAVVILLLSNRQRKKPLCRYFGLLKVNAITH